MPKRIDRRFIIGIDPGHSTGYVVFDKEKEEIFSHNTYQDKNTLFNIVKLLNWRHIDRVIIEEFRVFPWANLNFSELEVVEIIGVLKYLINPDDRIMSKTAYKTTFPDKKIKDLGYEIKYLDGHQKDAFRHALYYYHIKCNNTERLKIYMQKKRECI